MINLTLEFTKYQKFSKNEVYYVNGTILNIYTKKQYNIIKIKSKDFTFFTKTQKNDISVLESIKLYIITDKITFISYLKGFYANSFNLEITQPVINNKNKIYTYIQNQHNNNDITSLYSALFLALPINETVREFSNKFGISHLIAISGFHLGVISLVLYFFIHTIYNKIHSTYLPYRNKKYDVMLVVSFMLFIYLLFIDIPASFLRAFVMFIFGFYLLRNNIKIISFETLTIISLTIISLFPKLLFSLSLWFSIAGVFYIFLFIKYLQKINRVIQLILFNVWIYLAINPVTHYFFPTTTLEQLYSPLLSILFTIFYPITALLHIFNLGSVFDIGLEFLLSSKITNVEVYTKSWFLVLYLSTSLLAIVRKEAFIVLNILIVSYNIWLFNFIL